MKPRFKDHALPRSHFSAAQQRSALTYDRVFTAFKRAIDTDKPCPPRVLDDCIKYLSSVYSRTADAPAWDPQGIGSKRPDLGIYLPLGSVVGFVDGEGKWHRELRETQEKLVMRVLHAMGLAEVRLLQHTYTDKKRGGRRTFHSNKRFIWLHMPAVEALINEVGKAPRTFDAAVAGLKDRSIKLPDFIQVDERDRDALLGAGISLFGHLPGSRPALRKIRSYSKGGFSSSEEEKREIAASQLSSHISFFEESITDIERPLPPAKAKTLKETQAASPVETERTAANRPALTPKRVRFLRSHQHAGRAQTPVPAYKISATPIPSAYDAGTAAHESRQQYRQDATAKREWWLDAYQKNEVKKLPRSARKLTAKFTREENQFELDYTASLDGYWSANSYTSQLAATKARQFLSRYFPNIANFTAKEARDFLKFVTGNVWSRTCFRYLVGISHDGDNEVISLGDLNDKLDRLHKVRDLDSGSHSWGKRLIESYRLHYIEGGSFSDDGVPSMADIHALRREIAQVKGEWVRWNTDPAFYQKWAGKSAAERHMAAFAMEQEILTARGLNE